MKAGSRGTREHGPKRVDIYRTRDANEKESIPLETMRSARAARCSGRPSRRMARNPDGGASFPLPTSLATASRSITSQMPCSLASASVLPLASPLLVK